MPSRLIKEKEQQKLQDKYMEVDKESGKLVLTDNVNTTLLPNLNNIVDSQGHNRFVENNITLNSTIADLGVTQIYGKWSLSGTHLMIVQLLRIPAGISIKYTSSYGTVANLPTWIFNKITTVANDHVLVNQAPLYKSDWGVPSSVSVRLRKTSNLSIDALGNIEQSEDTRYLRIQFDLLIDSD